MESKEKLAFVIPDRTLFHERAPSLVEAEPLSAYCAKLDRVARMQNPQDIQLVLANAQVLFRAGVMQVRLDGSDLPPMRVTQTASYHLAREVLPARFFAGLRQLVHIDAAGAHLGEQVWSKFSQQCTTTRVMRAVNMRLEGGTVQRVARAVTSTDYSPYSNRCFVNDMAAVDELTTLPVLNFRLSDDGMVIRFSVLDIMQRLGLNMTDELLDHHIVPVISAWNSETGCRRAGLSSGLWKVKAGAVINHWLPDAERSWVHRGRTRRMTDQIRTTYQDQLARVQEVATAYAEASMISVGFDDALAWLVQFCDAAKVSERFKLGAVHALTNDKACAPGYTLATIVDALAISAQNESDFFMSDDMSKLASQALIHGLRQYNKHDRLLVEAP